MILKYTKLFKRRVYKLYFSNEMLQRKNDIVYDIIFINLERVTIIRVTSQIIILMVIDCK